MGSLGPAQRDTVTVWPPTFPEIKVTFAGATFPGAISVWNFTEAVAVTGEQ
jgi:hypothetical protein